MNFSGKKWAFLKSFKRLIYNNFFGYKKVQIEQLNGNRVRIQVTEGCLIRLQSNQPADDVKIISCRARLSGGTAALAEIKRKVTLVAQRIGILFDFESYGALNNGGFEKAGDLGLVGWLHAQHPGGHRFASSGE